MLPLRANICSLCYEKTSDTNSRCCDNSSWNSGYDIAATLITQLGNLVMVMFTIGVFAIGLMTVFGGIDIVKGGSVKDFFLELFDVIARLGR